LAHGEKRHEATYSFTYSLKAEIKLRRKTNDKGRTRWKMGRTRVLLSRVRHW